MNSYQGHHLVYIILNFKKIFAEPVYITYRSYEHYDADSFVQDIFNVPWAVMDDLDDIEDRLNAFHILFNTILDKHASIKHVKLRTRPNPFVTDEIKVLMQTRDDWRRLAVKTNNSNA